MAMGRDDLWREALALPEAKRADLAADLLASLDRAPADDLALVRALWAEEIGRRAQRAAVSTAGAQNWLAVRKRLTDELAR